MEQQDLEFFDQLVAHDQPPVWEGIDENEFAEERAPEDAPSVTAPRFYQPFEGAVILRDGQEPWWGGAYVNGIYYGSIGARERAQRIAIERAQLAAIREEGIRRQLHVLADWYLTQKIVESPVRAAAEISRAVRGVVGHALNSQHQELLAGILTSVIRDRARFELTDRGRRELAASTDDSQRSVAAAGRVG